ncbi:hypothetical protein Trco_002321 [Trichoderma cornu-damae]|uniref:Protein kinase domain-containing protein n=1 Tax=Trichoderma cornu-damae TaxID=654480 RepID=A0A9P8QME6_9HYPO|nr:hypothetical protein Trco_002321 [Trichoderma cornu-damae]
MPSPYPHLIVRRTAVKPTPLTSSRNLLAIQSALIRGDRVVTLHNTSRLLPEHYNNVRVPYEPEDMPQDQPLEWPFGDQYADPSSGVTSQPRLVDRFIDLLDWDGFRLEWIKVLGEGGFGMATLWDAIFEDQSRVKVVIKIPVRVNSDFDSELDWHLRYGGASHVTQSLDLQAMADSVRRRIGRGYMVGRGPRFVQTDLSVLVLEYAERGSLYEMMSKASYFGINFSNKALWEIWECLVKGVVSVAFQPDAMKRWGRDGLDGLLDALDDPKNINELIKISTLINSHDVHFDLEEQNVLVSEDDQHLHHPIFKETISKDWDKVDLNNPGRVSRYTGDFFGPRLNEVAGRYGTWTNVFMIGKIYTAQNQRCSGPSYGWRVCRPDYDYIEAELLDLVVQCQFEKPKDRPHLGYLLKKIYERKHRGFQETDYETRCFWDAFWAPAAAFAIAICANWESAHCARSCPAAQKPAVTAQRVFNGFIHKPCPKNSFCSRPTGGGIRSSGKSTA